MVRASGSQGGSTQPQHQIKKILRVQKTNQSQDKGDFKNQTAADLFLKLHNEEQFA